MPLRRLPPPPPKPLAIVREAPAWMREAVAHLEEFVLADWWTVCILAWKKQLAMGTDRMQRQVVIYTGAWATIFNVAGQSARSGLPRVGTLEGVIPQLSCEIGGKLLFSLMPPLREQLSASLWDTRAWTFQEGLLSPRRLFFTNHQVYFECNLVQCCESINDSRSAFHLLSDETREAASRNALHSPNALVYSDPDEEFDGVPSDPFSRRRKRASSRAFGCGNTINSCTAIRQRRCPWTLTPSTRFLPS
ncbi:hypothetical protein OG21DRAFT_575313 [Imleria badia]|nr:hypothetical protein OG21DRAFT_575313 [Imleria badia]